MEIEEKNKLLAEFLGILPNINGIYNSTEIRQGGLDFYMGFSGTYEILKFATDWNWLMVVTGKLIQDYEDTYSEQFVYQNLFDSVPSANIKMTFDACVEFILKINEDKANEQRRS